MNLNKHLEFFDPEDVQANIHIIGCGAIGSNIAELLTRLGIKNLHLYDHDTVTAHNITNQMYYNRHIGKPKLDALEEILLEINPEINITRHANGWTPGTTLSGYIFLAIDSIETRQQIVDENMYNTHINAMFDVRMNLTDAQHFAALWNTQEKQTFRKTMNFTSTEAKESQPISACGTTLSVTPTVRAICAYAVSNFINVVTNKHPIVKTLLIDAFNMTIDAFDENGPKQ